MARSIAERDSAVTLFFNVGRAMNTKFTKTKRERMFSKIVAKKKTHWPSSFTTRFNDNVVAHAPRCRWKKLEKLLIMTSSHTWHKCPHATQPGQ